MNKLYFLLLTLAIFNIASAQNSLNKKWDYRYGGTGRDYLSFIKNTSDGGFLLGGSSNSGISGDKTEDIWGNPLGNDYWIVKVDSAGKFEWDNDLGGFDDDILVDGIQTRDGGYLLGGSSYSDIGGDKTEDNTSIPGWYDFWILKINATGQKQWDITLGGVFTEYLSAIQQTSDGGYMLGGSSESPAGDDKSDENRGETGRYDYWIVKIDSLGRKEWDKAFGGDDEDILHSLQQTIDGGYILGGRTSSNSGWDKSQDVWGGPNDKDYWIVKIDSVGNKQWDKDLGGMGEDILKKVYATPDEDFILAGISTSGIGGDKSDPVWGDSSYFDLWVLKIDQFGNKLWDKTYGGTRAENNLTSLNPTNDGGYLIGATSYSGINGDKTEENLGVEQSWILKIDAEGQKLWDKTLHTTAHDEVGYVVETVDECYLMANSTYAGIGGDKSQENWDTIPLTNSSDYWIIKFCEPEPTSIKQEIFNTSVKTDPNPFTDQFFVSLSDQYNHSGTLTICNSVGVKVYSKVVEHTPANSILIDVAHLPSGIYFLYFNIDGNPGVRKLIKY